MKKTMLFSSILLLSLFLFACNKSIDKSDAKADAMKVVESLKDAPQAESNTTMVANEKASDLEIETEKKPTQADGKIIELSELEKQTKASEPEQNNTNTPLSKLDQNQLKIPDNKANATTTKSVVTEPIAAKSTKNTAIEKPTEQTATSKPSNMNGQNKKSDEQTEDAATSETLLDNFSQSTDQFLKQSVSNGSVAYLSLKKSAAINNLTEQIAAADLSKASSTEKQAFYINAYNVLVINSILENNIPSSPLDVLGFFDAKKHKVAGQMITLDELEKGRLFGLKKDPRFHFVAVCGARGCPQIEPFAYTPSSLNAQLNRQTQKALNDPNFTRVNDAEKKVELSEIFKWYESDFTQGGKSVIEFINQYRNQAIPTDYTVDYYPYDWKVNKR